MSKSAKEKIILALDVPGIPEARELIGRVGPRVGLYKIGLQLFLQSGPEVVRAVRETGSGVFLDLKLHDIPNTVGHAVESALALDVDMLTIHLSGGPEMVRAAVRAAGGSRVLLLGVSVLTSSDASVLAATGVACGVEEQVLRLAGLGSAAGIGGLVCSPLEIAPVRARFGGSLRLVTPGVRPLWADAGDQRRVMTPREAVDAGADYLVIGRPISAASDPAWAADRILKELS